MKKSILVLFIITATLSFSQSNSNTDGEDDCKFSPIKIFINDDDKGGTNIRHQPNSDVILTVYPELSWGIVLTVSANKDGWFKVDAIEDIEGNMNIKFSEDEGWIHHSVLGAGFTHTTKLFGTPNGIEIAKLEGETGIIFTLIAVCGEWAKIKYEEKIGWVKVNMICGSPVTNCS